MAELESQENDEASDAATVRTTARWGRREVLLISRPTHVVRELNRCRDRMHGTARETSRQGSLTGSGR